MAQQTMYPGIVNSPGTTLTSDITDSATTIPVAELGVFPAAPNEATIGVGVTAETIYYGAKSASTGAGNLTSVTREWNKTGTVGAKKAWSSGDRIGRNFTEYDYATFKANIEDLDSVKALKTGGTLDDTTIAGDAPLKFDLTPTVPGTVDPGMIYWKANEVTPTVQLTSDVAMPIGQKEFRRVYNPSPSVTIARGSAVYTLGVGGSPAVVSVGLACANSPSTAFVLGLTAEAIAPETQGFVVVRGHIGELNTNGFAAAGNVLYLDATTPGALTETVPNAPNLEIRVGRLIVKDPSAGKINVRISQSYALGDLADVNVASVVAGQLLKYNGESWVPADSAVVTSTGGTDFYLTDADEGIEGLSQAAACVVTWTSHGLATGALVKFEGITQAGWTALNSPSGTANVFHSITVTGLNTFTIPVNTSGYAAPYDAGTDPGTISSAKIFNTPDTTISTQTDSAQSTGSAEAPIDSYSTAAALGRTTIEGGEWLFKTWCYASSLTDTNTIVIRVYKRSAAGAETLLFYVETADLGVSPAVLSQVSSVQPAYAILATDYLVIKYFAKSNRGGGQYRTCYITHNGTTNYSYVKTPLSLGHSNLGQLDYASAGHTGFAPINAPAFTGVPTAPTPSPGTNTTQLATTEFVQTENPHPTLVSLADAPMAGGVRNGGFEYAPWFAAAQTAANWIDGTAAGSATNDRYGWYAYITGTANISYGTNKLVLSATATNGDIYVLSFNNSIPNHSKTSFPVKSATKYRISIRIKGTTLTTSYFKATEIDSSGAAIGGDITLATVSGTFDETIYQYLLTTSGTTAYVGLYFHLAAGTVSGAEITKIALEEIVDDTTCTSVIPTPFKPTIIGVTTTDNIDVSNAGAVAGYASAVGDAGGLDYVESQSFVPYRSRITGIYMKKNGVVGTPTGNFVVSIRADNAGSPGTTIIASKSYTLAEYNALANETDVFVDLPCTLTAGATYWIVWQDSVATEASNQYYTLGYTAAGYGTLKYSTNAGSTWSTNATASEYFKLCYAKSTEGATIVCNGEKISLSTGNEDGLLTGAMIDIAAGKYFYDSGYGAVAANLVANLLRLANDLYGSAGGNFSTNPWSINGWYYDATYGFISGTGSTDRYLIMKVNTLLPIKSLALTLTYACNTAGNASTAEISLDGTNFTVIDSRTGGLGTAGVCQTSLANGCSTFYLKLHKAATVNDYFSVMRIKIEADLDTASVPAPILQPIGKTVQYSGNVFIPATVDRIYLNNRSYVNDRGVTIPHLELCDATATVDSSRDSGFAAANHYHLLSSITEATATERCTIPCVRGHLISIQFKVVTRGNDDWVLVFHDSANVALGTVTIAHDAIADATAYTATCAVSCFTVLSQSGSIHFHLTSASDATVMSTTAHTLVDVSYIAYATRPVKSLPLKVDNTGETTGSYYNSVKFVVADCSGTPTIGSGAQDAATGNWCLRNGEYIGITGTALSIIKLTYQVGKETAPSTAVTAFTNLTMNRFYLSSDGLGGASKSPSHQFKFYVGMLKEGVTKVVEGLQQSVNDIARDILNYVPWTEWTPTLTWTGAAPVVGWTRARWTQIGKVVFFSLTIFASDNNGATNLTVSIPRQAAWGTGTNGTFYPVQSLIMSAVTANTWTWGLTRINGGSTVIEFAQAFTATDNANGYWMMSGFYEVA